MTDAMDVVLPTFGRFFQSQQRRINVIYGGAGSGKSVAVAQRIVDLFIRETDIRILVTRRTLPSLKITAYQLVRDILDGLGIPYEINRSDLVMTRGENQIHFKSLDDSEKIKSSEFNYIWAEEATELQRSDMLQLNLRLRRRNRGSTNRIYLTFNPIDQFHWLITDYVYAERDNVAIHHSSYKNNRRFLTQEYIEELEGLIDQDENYYRIYCLGEPGVLHNIIYQNYSIEPLPPAGSGADYFYGLDFGYNHPTALVEVRMRDGRPLVNERLYESRLTNLDLIDRLGEMGIPKSAPIYADAAEPARIEEIQRAGYNIRPASKAVKDGIDCVRRYRLVISENSTNLIAEIRSYKYKEDRHGVVHDEPVKFRDDACLVAGTMVHTATGLCPIEEIRVGDLVLTRQGFFPVAGCGITGFATDLRTIVLDDGTALTGTPDHPVLVGSGTFMPMDALRYGDNVWQTKSSSPVSGSGDTPTARDGELGTTTGQAPLTSSGESGTYTSRYGKPPTARSRQGAISITRTGTPSTTTSATSSVSRAGSIEPGTPESTRQIRHTSNDDERTWQRSGRSPRHGTGRTRGEHGIGSTPERYSPPSSRNGSPVNSAVPSTNASLSGLMCSVPTGVGQPHAAPPGSIWRRDCVNGAEQSSRQADSSRVAIAPSRVASLHIGRLDAPVPVYNLTIAGPPEFFANSILVHNCDALRYALFSHLPKAGGTAIPASALKIGRYVPAMSRVSTGIPRM